MVLDKKKGGAVVVEEENFRGHFVYLRYFHAQHQIRVGIHILFFLFLYKNIYCRYSLESSWQGFSNEYHNICFQWRNKKNISTFRLKESSYLGLWIYRGLTRVVILYEIYETSFGKFHKFHMK